MSFKRRLNRLEAIIKPVDPSAMAMRPTYEQFQEARGGIGWRLAWQRMDELRRSRELQLHHNLSASMLEWCAAILATWEQVDNEDLAAQDTAMFENYCKMEGLNVEAEQEFAMYCFLDELEILDRIEERKSIYASYYDMERLAHREDDKARWRAIMATVEQVRQLKHELAMMGAGLERAAGPGSGEGVAANGN